MRKRYLSVLFAAALACPFASSAQPTPPAPFKLKDEMRMPWTRSNERFIRRWLMLSEFPLTPGAPAFDADLLKEHGGESGIKPEPKMAHHLPDGSTTIEWREATSWGDAADLSNGAGLKRDLTGYAYTTITRTQAGKALLALGSDESMRVWVNGALVLDRRTRRQLTFDEDQVEVDLKAGDNGLLVKVEQHMGPWIFSARVFERGAVVPRIQEIGPSIVEDSAGTLAAVTDINKDRAALDKVTVQAIGAGGRVFGENSVPRGDTVKFDTAGWPSGAYELRFSTRRPNGLMYSTHIAWYRGDAIGAARELVDAAAKVDTKTPQGFTIKMLGDMVLDRLGKDGLKVAGNPWWAIHSPLMEYEELRLESQGKHTAIVRPFGFLRMAYRDPVDGSPQFCRVYLPGGYDAAKKWPLVVKIHGYNPANPDYVRWWSADMRHSSLADVEYTGGQGVIYLEAHGRGNTSYLGLGDQDIVRVIGLARQRLSIDDDRVYLSGDSMGGWGTWNVGTRHPHLFAAIAPIYGGVDYHSQRSEIELGKMAPLDRFLADKDSSWSMADSLLNLPILVHHGDVDRSVNVEYSRYGVRMLQRWGYDVRYVEMPGYGHEDLNVMGNIIEWFLTHRRDANPAHVRLRSAELQNASAYWVNAVQAASPRDFMVVDAEVVGPNRIRVDSENVLALELAPRMALIDPGRDVRVTWNGEERTARFEPGRGGSIRLLAAGYQPTAGEKNARVAGPLGDIINTPFAIVVGTIASDPAMKETCAKKGEAAAEFWKSWQRQPPRMFNDTELSDEDAARYSLLLIGGADANQVTRKLARQVGLEIAAGGVTIGGRKFDAAGGARVQMIVPNPSNPERYVLIAAGSNAAAMQLWNPSGLRNAEFDFTIEDGHVPSARERSARYQVWVAGGWFDRNWKLADPLVVAGDAALRSKSPLLRSAAPSEKALDGFTGAYQVMPGFQVKVSRIGTRLMVQTGDQPATEMLPIGDAAFYIVDGGVEVEFQKAGDGSVSSFQGWQNGQQFTGKKLNK